MADETPDVPNAETKPAPRRRGPNKVRSDASAKSGRKPRSAKTVAEAVTGTADKAEAAVVEAAKKPAAAVSGAAKAAVKAIKPRAAAKRTTPRPATKTRPSGKEKRGWGSAAIAGGLAAAGAVATAAVFALRSSTPKPAPKLPAPTPQPKAGGAHQPDGADSSKSFDAGIADESSIPDQA